MSGMLHPKFNHLGTSKRVKVPASKEYIAAREAHNRFLAKHGIAVSKPKNGYTQTKRIARQRTA